jgi:hypothetical protein
MTKARDLAGFSTGSITNTTADGLILKGDGSSTDVVIKNGADATVASVADGTVNIAAAGSITATGAVTRSLTRGSIDVGNSSGVSAPLAAGGADTVLTSDGTDISWAVAEGGGIDPVVFPNIASPNNTYTSSGTWSKGSLSDNDYVWFYLVGGGGGGGSSTQGMTGYAVAGSGGNAILVYGKAKYFDGAAYVIGAGAAAGTTYVNTNRTQSTLTLTATYGSIPFQTSAGENYDNEIFYYVESGKVTMTTTLVTSIANPTNAFTVPTSEPTGWSGSTGTLYTWTGGAGAYGNYAWNGIFGAGGGGGYWPNASIAAAGGSLYAGAGAAGSTGAASAGSVPGGGGGASSSSSVNGGAGGNGNMRVYHV